MLYLKYLLEIKDAKLKKLTDENQKLTLEMNKVAANRSVHSLADDAKSELDFLKRQVRTLEEKLRRLQKPAEKPFENQRARSKVQYIRFFIIC